LKPFDSRGVFAPSVLESGDALRKRAVRSAGVTIFSGVLTLVIQMAATIVLARLIAPREFGLVAMATTFSLLLSNIGLNGITEAIVQADSIDRSLASCLFWINLAVGVVLTIGFAAAGPLLAWFYKEPILVPLSIGLSATILFTSLSVLHLALLKRAMMFTAVGMNDIVARGVSVVVSIVLGFAGYGVWALVLGACALPLTTTIGAWILCRWLPGRARFSTETGSLLRFAVSTYARFSLNYCTRNSDNLLVGWRFGAHLLGFYKKAYDLFTLSAAQLVSSTTVVAVSALSRVRDDRAQFSRLLYGAMAVLAFLGMGLSGVLTLIGRDLIRLLLGPKWGPSGYIFTFFAPGIGAMLLYGTHGWIHLSIGEARRWFRWGFVELIVTIILFLIGLHWGAPGVAVAWCLSFWILTIPAIMYAGAPINLEIRPVLSLAWRYIIAALLAALASQFILSHLHRLAGLSGASGAALRIFCASSVFTLLYLAGIVLLYGGYAPLRSLGNLLREVLYDSKGKFISVPRTPGMELPLTPREFRVDFQSAERPLVSILIPAYNAEEWVAETLCSALAQTWEPKEIILVDDGSSDRTLEVARRFESPIVRIVAQPNRGASAARNTALPLSQGEYIQWLDADDLLAPDKIALQMEAVKRGTGGRTLLSSEWGSFMYGTAQAQFLPTALWESLPPLEWLHRKMGQNLFMQTATWLVSRELTEVTGQWDERLLHDDDGEYFCRAVMASDGVKFVPGSRVYYRCFGINSLSHIGTSDAKIASFWLSIQLHLRYLQSLDQSDRMQTTSLTYLREALINFYPEHREILSEIADMERQLGGRLELPQLSWEYVWLRNIFGWHAVKPAQRFLRKIRWSSERYVRKVMFEMSSMHRVDSRQAAPVPAANGSVRSLSADRDPATAENVAAPTTEDKSESELRRV
jgi:O-antigen/teichoic acid export membrane protein/glycosyltransferase involved in cell wall biosynthesis